MCKQETQICCQTDGSHNFDRRLNSTLSESGVISFFSFSQKITVQLNIC